MTTANQDINGVADDNAFRVFWTAFDPLDVATGSIDPTGFVRGYLALVDRLLPGMTTVTDVPRYASMLCAAASVAATEIPARDDLRGAKLRQKRIVLMKAYERAWALACGLAVRDVGPTALEGVRGVRYVTRRLDLLTPSTKYIKSSSFNLLSNQVRHGGIGVYSAFLDSCHILTSEDLSLRPSGERLAAAFPSPPRDVAAHDEEARLKIAALRHWGARANPSRVTRSEERYLADALKGGGESDWNDEVRWSMLRLLAAHAAVKPTPEAQTLKAILAGLGSNTGVAKQLPRACADQIRGVLTIVDAYERLHQAVLFLFQAIQAAATDRLEVSLAELGSLDSIRAAVAATTRASRDLPVALERAFESHAGSAGPVADVLRTSGVTGFAEQLLLAQDLESVLALVLSRHEAVQGGKFDEGVRKTSWLKRLPSGKLRLSAQRFRLSVSARSRKWSEVERHRYRTEAAFAFIRACGGRIQ